MGREPSSVQRPDWRNRLVSAYFRRPDHACRLRILGLLQRLLGVEKVRTEVVPGVIMDLDGGDYVQREILLHGSYEPLSIALAETLLNNASARCFVDVGAHVGQYSLRAARALFGRGQVVAFEPTPGNAAQLQRNLRLSGLPNLKVFACGISDRAAVVPMAQSHPANSGGSGIISDVASASHFASVVPLAWALRCAGVDRIDLVKIDVEGHEPAVLDSLFAPGVPRPQHVIVEFQPEVFSYAGGPEAVPSLLRAQGYVLRTVEGRPYLAGDPLPESNLWGEWKGSAGL